MPRKSELSKAMPEGFVRVASLAELRDGKGRRVTVGEHEIALWRVNGTVYAVGNVCAHQHFSMIHEGTLEGLTVRCPMHGWEYSLENGKARGTGGRIPVFDVLLDGEFVLVSQEPRRSEGM